MSNDTDEKAIKAQDLSGTSNGSASEDAAASAAAARKQTHDKNVRVLKHGWFNGLAGAEATLVDVGEDKSLID